jgi:hypothetical protein
VDQGIGRALWFVIGADVARVAAQIERFAPHRRADLWSGAGLAATYAGGADDDELAALVRHAGAARSHLAQGAAFAITARSVAGNPAPHSDDAARVLADRSASELARLAIELEPATPTRPFGDGYETWRTRLRDALVIREAA